MTKNLLDKMGINVFHNNTTSPWVRSQVERAVRYANMAGMKYIRPAYNLQTDEFNGTYNNWREEPYKMFVQHGLTPIVGAYPQQIKNHLLDDNADSLVDQAVTAYANIMDGLIKVGVTDFIVEAWNETDGKFAVDQQTTAQTNDTIIDRYLTFNMKLFEECKKRRIRFMDLCSIQYPKASDLKHVMDCYNAKLNSYSSLPDWVSFHPYCERNSDNFIPELYMNTFSTSDWNNISKIPLAISEFGYPSEDWGHPFSGRYPYQYSRDMMIRQIIIHDFLGVDPIIIYSGNTNPDPTDADTDDCWGAYQYTKSDGTIRLSKLGSSTLSFLQSMKGYHINPQPVRMPTGTSEIAYTDFAFEYDNDNGHKKLFYWNPFGHKTETVNWNGQSYNLTFNQHVKVIEV